MVVVCRVVGWGVVVVYVVVIQGVLMVRRLWLWQGRPLNVNHEAACFIGKTGEEVEKGALCLKLGGEEYAFFNER